ncbi:Protein of unknown function DUF457, transmembrane [Sulfobacillus acidophilus DSM 10332]|uniref:Metal-dependent hydrolase n=1 Tax=Sulfobacillus acidophilus (strain ATCC 700253 / DSM 10332 / NAL) TaxID=679936 RepID=G8TV67_SULAD|nr:Protein of unknown function DUF457, transmembrane [Sulfobacillus acidophilus DSM 10332]
MLAKTHIVAGVTAATVVAVVTHHPLSPAVLISGGLAGLAPDLDHPQALMTRKIPGASLIAGAAQQSGLIRHRGVLHSILFLWLTGWIGWRALTTAMSHGLWAIAVMLHLTSLMLAGIHAWQHGWLAGGLWAWYAGYGSHLLVDSWNTTGVQWFWPWASKVHFPWPNITVGTWPETVVRWGMVAALAVWHWPDALIVAAVAEGIYREMH